MLKTLIEATGLPEVVIKKEVDRIIHEAGLKREELSLDELRQVMATYLQDVFLEIKDQGDQKVS